MHQNRGSIGQQILFIPWQKDQMLPHVAERQVVFLKQFIANVRDTPDRNYNADTIAWMKETMKLRTFFK
jgi:hypothetical protein